MAGKQGLGVFSTMVRWHAGQMPACALMGADRGVNPHTHLDLPPCIFLRDVAVSPLGPLQKAAARSAHDQHAHMDCCMLSDRLCGSPRPPGTCRPSADRPRWSDSSEASGLGGSAPHPTEPSPSRPDHRPHHRHRAIRPGVIMLRLVPNNSNIWAPNIPEGHHGVGRIHVRNT